MSSIALVAMTASFLWNSAFALQTRLSNAQIVSMNTAESAQKGINYWNTDLLKYHVGQPDGTLSDLGELVATRKDTTVEVDTIHTNKTADPGVLYWDKNGKNYRVGQNDGSLTNASDAASQRLTASQIQTMLSTNAGGSGDGVLFWDRENRRYYQSESNALRGFGDTMKTITLTFDGVPSNVTVIPTQLKYDKDFALSWTFDDGYGTIYRNMYPLLNGGYSDIDRTVHPGLFFTDGAGSDVPFTAAEAWFTRQSPALNQMHASDQADFWMANDEMIEMIDHGWGIVHHGLTSAAFRDTRIADGDPLIQYPTPPGPDALNYSYEVSQGAIEVESDLGFPVTTFIAPSGDDEYRKEAYDQGYRFISARNGTRSYGGNEYVVENKALQVDNLDTSDLVMGYRRSLSDSLFTPANMMDFTTATVAQLGENDHRWISESAHQVTEEINGGSILYTTIKPYFQQIASTYGKVGADNLWVAGVPEVYEYQLVKDNVQIATEQAGNTVTVTLDLTNVPEDLWYSAISLNVSSDKNLTAVDYNNGDFSNYSHNLSTGLINLDWSSRWGTLANKYVAIAEASQLQADVQSAQVFVNNIDDTDKKTPYQNRINAIVINTDKIYKIDIGSGNSTYDTSGNWTNITVDNLTETNLLNTNGEVSTMDLTVTGYYITDGGISEEYCELYPYSAMRDSFRVDIANPLTLTFSSLDNDHLYDFKILAGRRYGDTANTSFTIGGVTKTLQALDNFTNNTITIENVSPSSGTIVLTATSPVDDRGFINVIEITETDPSGATCFDSTKNQDETDVDCGGSTCGGCDLTDDCSINGDCTSGNCSGDVCVAVASCSDGITNQDETDTDCGGSTCSSCSNGDTCSVNGDCSSGNCSAGTCAVVSAAAATWYLDIGQHGFYETSDIGWNNITDDVDERSVTNAIDSNGNVTGVGFATTGYIYRYGGSSVDTVGYPVFATRDGFMVDDEQSPLVLTVTGLNDAATYDFTFFGAKNGGNSAITKFTIGGSSTTLQTQGNIGDGAQTATLSAVSPSGGEVVISVEPQAGETWGFFGVLEVNQNE